MSKIKNIFSGWKNYIIPNPVADALALERSKHCAGCPHAVHIQHLANIHDKIEVIEGYVCNICSCPLSAKLRSTEPDNACPDNPAKW